MMNFGMRRRRRSLATKASYSARVAAPSSATAKRGSVTSITGRSWPSRVFAVAKPPGVASRLRSLSPSITRRSPGGRVLERADVGLLHLHHGAHDPRGAGRVAAHQVGQFRVVDLPGQA